ncbi:hypothetical protein MLD38_016656 [Melastoma candidum]|uniref:Uncharacterized protein n=1 Tax=Melastoma candidum TaxID=119954 RepID=A0ACB9QWB0_9MYRT|nr:hypothetical protein MLD38_016656 [Melastoma candidum]
MQKQGGNKPNNNASKARSTSSWGSNIVKNFSNQDRKTKVILNSKPQNCPQNQSLGMSHSRVKRSLIGDLSCTINPVQVIGSGYHHRQGSRDLLVELDHLRGLLSESRDRECKLQAELSDCRRSLEREVEVGKSEVEDLRRRVGLLECEKDRLLEQLPTAAAGKEDDRGGPNSGSFCFGIAAEGLVSRDLEMEIVELRRVNKELQMQKRSLSCRLSAAETQLAGILARGNESDSVAKIKAEASVLRHTNEELCKQVEGLQISRLNEVEELAYLRWVNSCLRSELCNCSTDVSSDRTLSPCSTVTDSVSLLSTRSSESRDYSTAAKRVGFAKKFKKWPPTGQELQNFDSSDDSSPVNWIQKSDERSPRRHSISGGKCSGDDMFRSKRRQSDGFLCSKEGEIGHEILVPPTCEWGLRRRSPLYENCHESSKLTIPVEVEKRALRIPKPPPRPSCSFSNESKKESPSQIQPPPRPPPPPPPPPPLSKFSVKASAGVVKRAPQVLEFYHSLMKRESRKDSANGGTYEVPDFENVRSSMIGEIETRSSHLLAIKADVETQGEFIDLLIREVNSATYDNIEDVVAFVKWLDDELCFLVDERAVLKHFDWPEKKADNLREAAFGYRDLKMLESEICYFEDDPRITCDSALRKIVTLSDKMERTVYNLLRTRESLMLGFKEYQIPVDWMMDNGIIISKIKLGSVKLAQKYMKRVAMELQMKATQDKDPTMDYMLLQGVRFAFRIHQFAGGFDSETMQAFEELRNLAKLRSK